jgi:NAD+ synthase (glutamine-hydrolysing)
MQFFRRFSQVNHQPKHVLHGKVARKKIDLTLHPDLQKKLLAYRAKRAFDAKSWIQKKCEKYNEYMQKSKLSAALVSLSGGVDSAVTLGLMRRSMDMKNSPLKRILGINQPIHSSGWAGERAAECAKKFDAQFVVIDQSNLQDQLASLVEKQMGIAGKSFAIGQLRSYMRTPVGYFVAQLLSQEGTPCVVMGTGNMDEDGYLAYFCKAGDGVVDIQLIADIHKSEVFKVGKELGVPDSILKAAPSADLWEGQTDEDELGFSYDFVELLTGDYLKLNEESKAAWKAELSPEALEQFNTWDKAAEGVHNRNKHKLSSPHNINIL